MENTFTKRDSLILKGMAILFMLFLHLFNQMQNVDLCTNFIYIGDRPFVFLLSRFTHICVPMYLFLSGYGLYISYSAGNGRRSWKRLIPLWINYVLILAVFVSIGTALNPQRYIGSFSELMQNILLWSYSYNGEWWFLFPYFVLVLISIPFFRLLDKTKSWIALVALISIGSITHIILKLHYSAYFTLSDFTVKPVLVLNCLFAFGIGALFAKENIICRIRRRLSIYLSIYKYYNSVDNF